MKRFIEKKNVFFLLVLIGIFSISFSVFASKLELDWPASPGGIDLNTENSQTITYLIAYIYEWAMVIGGMATFIALVSAGFQYLTSVGDTSKMTDAKKQITSAITGLTLLLSTFLIISVINPELTTLDIPEISLEGGGFNPIIVGGAELSEKCSKIKVLWITTATDPLGVTISTPNHVYIQKDSPEKIIIPEYESRIRFEKDDDEKDFCIVYLYSNEDCDEENDGLIKTISESQYIYNSDKIKCIKLVGVPN